MPINTVKVLLWGGGSGYRTYVFKEFIKYCAIDRKGQGRKEGDIPTRN